MTPELPHDRARRRWKIVLAVGIFLALGPALGQFGVIVGMIHSFHAIDAARAPTPGDLAVGVNISMLSTVLGLLAGVLGVPLIILGCIQLARHRENPPAEPHAP